MYRLLVIFAQFMAVAIAIKKLLETIEGILAAFEGICKRTKAIWTYFRRPSKPEIILAERVITPATNFRNGFLFGIGLLLLVVLAASLTFHSARQLRSGSFA